MKLYDQIKSHFLLPDAYKDWTYYRDTLTRYLISQTDLIPLPLSFHAGMKQSEMLPTLAIIGAGACNDIDLSRIAPHFSKITLIDNDETAMKKALRIYHLEDSPSICLLPVSLNGITDSDYRQFCDSLQTYIQLPSFTPEEFEAFSISQIEHIFQRNRLTAIPLAPVSYDYIWCFGVHSQLQAMFSYIYHVFTVNLQNMLFPDTSIPGEAFSNCLKEENDFFIPRFHDALLSSAKTAVFVGCEQKRSGQETPIEGACQAIHDLRRRSLSLTESTILWNFYPAGGISYEMLIQKITF
ncbi:MAG: hypothetical protein HFJ06_04865 [Lachnospiraceae bacterium]|nr:hypothetical protein [Lachnospiraceae bacterium]